MAQRKREVSLHRAELAASAVGRGAGASKRPPSRWLEVPRASSAVVPGGRSGSLGFPHLTIQEYLAASHWARTSTFPLHLRHLVSESWWYEAVRLYQRRAMPPRSWRSVEVRGSKRTGPGSGPYGRGQQLAPSLRERVNEACKWLWIPVMPVKPPQPPPAAPSH